MDLHSLLTISGVKWVVPQLNGDFKRMILSRQSLEMLLDLIEIKVNAIEMEDREDIRELNRLKRCRQELIIELKKPSVGYTKKAAMKKSSCAL